MIANCIIKNREKLSFFDETYISILLTICYHYALLTRFLRRFCQNSNKYASKLFWPINIKNKEYHEDMRNIYDIYIWPITVHVSKLRAPPPP